MHWTAKLRIRDLHQRARILKYIINNLWNIFATVYVDLGSIKPVLFEKRYKFIWYFQVLEDALEWLNEWEMVFRTGDITANEYLTPETSRGFRLTLQSSINMCRYLIEKFNFQYFLTGKVNQDNLEVFLIYIDFCNEKTTCLWYYIICVRTISFRNSLVWFIKPQDVMITRIVLHSCSFTNYYLYIV